MFECPATYFEKNLIFDNQKSCWGVYRLNGFNYNTKSEENKIEIMHNITCMLATIADEATILVLPSMVDLDFHYKGLLEELDENDPLFAYTSNYHKLTKQYLKNKAAKNGNNTYETYIIVKLVSEDDGSAAGSAIDFLFKSPVNAINTFMATDSKDIMESKLRHFEKLANSFLNEQTKRVTMHPATSTQVQWLLKRVMYRGFEHKIKLNMAAKTEKENGKRKTTFTDWMPFAQRKTAPDGKDTIIRPYSKDVVNLFNGTINTKHKRMLAIEHDNGDISYQTFMVITHIPDMLDFPDNEWIYFSQNLKLLWQKHDINVQPEICIHISNIEHREALRKIELKRREINSQFKNADEARADIPEDLYNSKDEAVELERELKAGRLPISKVCVSFCLFGTSPEEVDRKADFIKDTYSDYHFVTERPVADQLKLFFQHIPAAGHYSKDFDMMLTPTTIAGGIIGATDKLGDDTGVYIGTTGELETPVFFDMGRACIEDESASATFFGNLGYGKSFNTNDLLFKNVINGGFGLIFDPKGERSHWRKKLPMLAGHMTIVTMDANEENRGKLDPFIIYRDNFANASNLALNVIAELFKLKPLDPEYTALAETIGLLKGVEKPCMLKLCQMLESYDEKDDLYKNAKGLARLLRSIQNVGMAMLLFGTGNEEGITLNNRLNILQIENLSLPQTDTKREDYTSEETVSIIIMMVLGNFAKRFALTPRPTYKIILFDESWALSKTAEGIKMYEFLARSGRSLNTGCIFNGHSVLDIATETIKNAITYKFCFHTNNTDEAIRMLEYVEMEKTQDNIKLIKGLQNRQCLFKDRHGQIGVLTFDAVFDDIKAVFKTTPKTRKEFEADRLAPAGEAAALPEAAGQDESAEPDGREPIGDGASVAAEIVNNDLAQVYTLREDLFVREII